MKIKNLFVQSFRGATQPLKVEFDPGKSITMIFGENGNGKSTIADALVCLCTDGVGSIDRASADKSYLSSIGAAPADVLIALDTDLGKFSATLAARPANTFIKSPADGIPNLRLLRRKQIIDLIDEQPAKRYELLQEYLDVSGVMSSENELRRLIKTNQTELERENTSLADGERTLENAWNSEGRPNGSWEEWAKVESVKEIAKETERHSQLSSCIKHWREIQHRFTEIRKQKDDLTQSLQKVEKVRKELSLLEKQSKEGGTKLLSVLESAQKYITEQLELKACPVCKNDIVREDLLRSLKKEVSSMNTLQSSSIELASAEKEEGRIKAILENSLKEFKTPVISFCSNFSVIVNKGSAAEKMTSEILVNSGKGSAFESIETHSKALDDLMQKIETEAAKIDTSLKQFNLINSSYKSIVAGREKVSSLDLLKKALEKTHTIVESTRKAFIESSLNSVSSDIGELYERIHEGEALGDIKLLLKSTGKNSIEINSTFYGEKEVTPQSLYSESHLDTLGICIFIALARKYNQGNTILLLDDVMMSVDETHLDRFIDLLHDVSNDFAHVLITTHYRPWRDRYRNSRAPASKVHFLELRPWSKDRGITFQNGRIEAAELKVLLDDSYFDRQNVATMAGRLLENLLDFLTYKFGSRLARKPRNEYALRELLDALSKKLLGAMKVEHLQKNPDGKFSKTEIKLKQELKAMIDNLKDLSFVRNQVGAHFNLEGSSVSDKDIMEFGKNVLDLADLLICPELGSLPTKDQGSYWETKSGSLRLYPLKEPT